MCVCLSVSVCVCVCVCIWVDEWVFGHVSVFQLLEESPINVLRLAIFDEKHHGCAKFE